MKQYSIKQVKEDLEINFKKMYGDKTLEEVIEFELKPYMFDKTKIERYKEEYYLSVQKFLYFTEQCIIAVPLWDKLLKDECNDLYIDYIKSKIETIYKENTYEIFREK